MRVLLLAEMCNPEWASVPYFGYRLARAIVDRVDEATVVSVSRNRAGLEKHGFGRARVDFVDTSAIDSPFRELGRLLRGGSTLGWSTATAFRYPGYLAFEWLVWKRYRQLIADGRFDVVHRVTPLSPMLPSPMACWSPVPFVIGPVNGGLPWPPGFGAELLREREWLQPLRRLHAILPYYRASYSRAAAVLAGFRHTSEHLPAAARSHTYHFSDVGFDDDVFQPPPSRSAGQVTVLSVGRLVPLKCTDVLVRAFARSPILRQHRLLIVGSGPEGPRLAQLVEQHGLKDCVSLVGWADRNEVARLMRESHIFAFPSVKDLGGGVVLEAMASGMACVLVDYGGAANYLPPGGGVKVPLGTKTELVESYVRELERLVGDTEGREAMGMEAYRHVSSRHSWSRKAGQVEEVYRWVTGRTSTKPPLNLADHEHPAGD
jgi:glycosyltransferase involved in cell wall biosynthesis